MTRRAKLKKVPKVDNDTILTDDIVKVLPRKQAVKNIDITVDDVREWERKLIPSGAGVKAIYEKMTVAELDQEYEKGAALAKMYIIDRIMKLTPMETDMGKLSGALKDVHNVAKASDTMIENGASPWSDYVQQALKTIKKKNINITQNTLNYNAKGEN